MLKKELLTVTLIEKCSELEKKHVYSDRDHVGCGCDQVGVPAVSGDHCPAGVLTPHPQ